MGLLKLDVYKKGTLQDLKSILIQGIRLEMSSGDILREVEYKLMESAPEQGPSPPPSSRFKRCPSCGRGVLLPTKTEDELGRRATDIKVVECRQCRYSEVA